MAHESSKYKTHLSHKTFYELAHFFVHLNNLVEFFFFYFDSLTFVYNDNDFKNE